MFMKVYLLSHYFIHVFNSLIVGMGLTGRLKLNKATMAEISKKEKKAKAKTEKAKTKSAKCKFWIF